MQSQLTKLCASTLDRFAALARIACDTASRTVAA